MFIQLLAYFYLIMHCRSIRGFCSSNSRIRTKSIVNRILNGSQIMLLRTIPFKIKLILKLDKSIEYCVNVVDL